MKPGKIRVEPLSVAGSKGVTGHPEKTMARATMTVSDIDSLLERVRSKFLKRDIDLLKARAHERSIIHRIAVYIEEEIPDNPKWHIDCEYNRHGIKGNPKRGHAAKRRFPDLIVHQRGSDKHNLLIIEGKADWASAENKNKDKLKIDYIFCKFNYKFAYLLYYSMTDIWFEPAPKKAIR